MDQNQNQNNLPSNGNQNANQQQEQDIYMEADAMDAPSREETGASDTIAPICSICHSEPPVNAIQLNCGHIFCYLCIKSVVETSGACALCRVEIGLEFNFQEHQVLGTVQLPTAHVDEISGQKYYWFYQGYSGWWLYDAETSRDLEKAYQLFKADQHSSILERFIAGFTYVIDFNIMAQQRKNGEGRARKICRETLDLEPIVGMAGLKGKDFDEILYMIRSAAKLF